MDLFPLPVVIGTIGIIVIAVRVMLFMKKKPASKKQHSEQSAIKFYIP